MGKADKYTISLKSLSEGTHSYEYTLDHTFFSEIDSPEIQNGDVNIGLMLRRTGDTFELHFDIKGHIVIPCDRCLDDMELKTSSSFPKQKELSTWRGICTNVSHSPFR